MNLITFRASKRNPCPVCSSASKNCSAIADGLHFCRGNARAGWRKVGEDDNGFGHYRRNHEPQTKPSKTKLARPKPPTNWQAEAERFAMNLMEFPERRTLLAKALGLPVEALDGFTLGVRGNERDGVEFTIPERDGTEAIIGLATRTERTGKPAVKKSASGSKRGLTVPDGWRERNGPLLFVEGFTDTAALTAAGLCAIGRANNLHGVELLAKLLANDPTDRVILVVGENDTNGAGLEGAVRVSQRLSTALSRTVAYALPPVNAKDVREWLTADVRAESSWHERGAELLRYLEANATIANFPSERESENPLHTQRKVETGADELRVNNEAVAALAGEDGLYQRGGQLVSIGQPLDVTATEANVRRAIGVTKIRPLTLPGLRERLTRCVHFYGLKQTRDGVVERHDHSPSWCTSAVFDRGCWPVPVLEAVVPHPAFLPTGSLLATTGYDPGSGLYSFLEANLELTVPERPTPEDVARAVATLEDVLFDFPFQTTAHKGAWFAALLTPLAWFAFEGPAPFFLIDANTPGTGKGLLADVIAIIVTGSEFQRTTYTPDREELRKRITAFAIGGERMVLFDNLAGSVGNDVFDNALTSISWKDRILGGNTNYEGPLHVTWYGTGNNVQLGADTARRTCHIRMESLEERPEHKEGFRHLKLREYVRRRRGKFLSAALTILRGWHVAGRPTHNLRNWGSFEEWSGIVREAVVFAGLDDPILTLEELQRASDRDPNLMKIILDAMQRLDPNRHGLTTAELIHRSQGSENAELRSALEELCGKLDGRKLGGRFKHFQQRNFGGKMLDKAGEDRNKSSRWAVFAVGPAANRTETEPASLAIRQPNAGDAGDAGSIPPHAASTESLFGETYRGLPD